MSEALSGGDGGAEGVRYGGVVGIGVLVACFCRGERYLNYIIVWHLS